MTPADPSKPLYAACISLVLFVFLHCVLLVVTLALCLLIAGTTKTAAATRTAFPWSVSKGTKIERFSISIMGSKLLCTQASTGYYNDLTGFDRRKMTGFMCVPSNITSDTSSSIPSSAFTNQRDSEGWRH